MSQKLTPKQEAFALKYVECGNASEAYRHAYNAENMKLETIHVKACTELAKDHVAVRVEELQEQHRAKHDVTVDSIVGELEEARGLALRKDQASAAVTASMGKAKLHGLIVDKQEHSGEVTLSKSHSKIAERFAKRFTGKND